MKIQHDNRARYENPVIQRQFDLTQALIAFRSYTWGHVDKVAHELSDEEVATFCRVVDRLNGELTPDANATLLPPRKQA